MELWQRTLEALDWPFVARELARHARTPAGARRAAEIELSIDSEKIERELDAVDEVFALADAGLGSPPVGGVEDIADVVERAARGEVLELAELRACRSTVATLAELRRFVRAQARTVPTLAELADRIDLEPRFCVTLDAALDERGELSEKTYPVLADLRRRIASLDRRVRAVLEDLLGSSDLQDVLQDRYVTLRADRFVLPIKARAKGSNLGIVHDASRTGQTVFVEPHQVVPLNNERRLAEADLQAEDRRIRAELSEQIGRHDVSIYEALEAAIAVDLACARTDFARRLDATRPRLAKDGTVDLRLARHPILALGKDVVANDLRLTRERPVLVLTGPNAGGKTVALKTLGLCALLVRAGCFVPAAAGSHVTVFPEVLADIGDQQTVHAGLSSFSAHLTTLRAMLEICGPGTLLLLDEIASGTDPSQGGALARALIERFASAGAHVVATTHYAQVKAMSADDGRVELAALEYRDGRPTYHVVPGVAGESHALPAALRVGIDPAVIERARALMDEGERALQDAVVALEAERARSQELSERAAEAATALAKREASLAEREEKLKQHVREIEQQEARAFVERVRDAEREIRRIVAELQRTPTPERAARARQAVRALETGIEAQLPVDATPAKEPAPGDKVTVPRLGVSGEIASIHDGEVEVHAGALTVRVPLDEIKVSAEPAKPRGENAARGVRRAVGGASASERLDHAVRMPANTLDLRGARVEEGLARLESFLDDAMLSNRDAVFVLHGHGTGALRSAIRKALAGSPYVAASGPAPADQGGDAFTVAVLRG